MSFIGSGVLFTNQTNVLAGYNIKINAISGIGGKPVDTEDPDVTAIREMLEELFELNSNLNYALFNST